MPGPVEGWVTVRGNLAAVAATGFAARLGGEEFLLVLPLTPVAADRNLYAPNKPDVTGS